MLPLRLAIALVLTLLLGCPPSSTSSRTDASTATCVREGDRCVYAEGKIGLCTAKPGCQGDGCLVCMSLH